jgi:eukaryotic-like serine/threonine-protein kinase
MIRQGRCPSEAELAAYAHGGTAVGVDLAEHLACCARCRAVVAVERMVEPTTLVAGTLIGRYRIEDRLGAGGMGVVYRAIDTELERPVALKLVRPHAGQADALAERLRRESKLQARAAHRAVITVYDIGREGDQIYVAMELIRGGTLRDWLAAAPRSWRDILDLFGRAAEGLAAAHAAGLVHRDVKPDNVLVETDRGAVTRVLVTDFGVARAIGAADVIQTPSDATEVAITAVGTLVGTPAYMSPEQLTGGAIDTRSDVFSFAAALWEALYHELPFKGGSVHQIAANMQRRPKPPAATSVPRWIPAALRRGLAIDAAERTSSMAALVASLNWRRRRRRRRWGVAGVATLAGALGAAGIVLATRSPPPSPCGPLARVDGSLGRAIDQLNHASAATPDALGQTWRTRAERYRRDWGRLRDDVCAAPDEPSLATRVRCLERTADETAGLLAAAAALDEPHRARMMRGWWLAAPVECRTDAAETTARLALAEPPAWRARAAIDALAVPPDPAELANVRALVAAAHTPLLERRLALGELLDDNAAKDHLRTLAIDAERAGDMQTAADIWRRVLGHMIGDNAPVDQMRDVLGHADLALSRAGDPPPLRAAWYADQAFIAAAAGQPGAMLDAVSHARALEAAHGIDVDVGIDATILAAYVRGARPDLERPAFRRLIDVATKSGEPAQSLIAMHNNHALALRQMGVAPDEIRAELEPLLANVDRSRRLAVPDLALTLKLVMNAYTLAGHNDKTLELFESFRGAIEATFPPDSLAIAHLDVERVFALANVGRTAEAERVCWHARDVYLSKLGPSSASTIDLTMLYGQLLVELGRYDEGGHLLERAVADYAKIDDGIRVASGRLSLAVALIAQGELAKARDAAELALARYELGHADPSTIGQTRSVLARAIANTDPTRARQLLAQAIPAIVDDPSLSKELAAARELAKRLRVK